MSYIVIERFADLQDSNRIYEAGDTYPRPGFNVAPERIAELAGSDNRMGYPLIKRAETPAERAEAEADKIPAETAEPPKKGRRTRNKG